MGRHGREDSKMASKVSTYGCTPSVHILFASYLVRRSCEHGSEKGFTDVIKVIILDFKIGRIS